MEVKDFKGTKGKWKIATKSDRCISLNTDKRGSFIDCWGGEIADVSTEEMKANMQLILTSKELLNACIKASKIMNLPYLEKAIKKALK